MAFTKMHGLGNDFVLIDCRDEDRFLSVDLPSLAQRLGDRRSGIGFDQLLLLFPSSVADFRMLIFNADGGEVEMCGNGIRCFARYVWDRELSTKDVLEVETLAGIIRPERVGGGLVKVDMGEPVLDPVRIPVRVDAAPPVIDFPLQVKDREFRLTFVSMGNPHAVAFLDGAVEEFPLETYGPEIETHPLFPRRTNVEFVRVRGRNEMDMRVWERGAGMTLSCGTGASAAGVAAMLKGLTERKVTLHLARGDLVIEWAEDNHVFMTGPAAEVFTGRVGI
ncbi:MAG: diaminopimelate epimerase [Nitrospirales bacterium]|nr:diaminopimelate epimerase [Nitrospirales bacterium]